MTKEEVAKKMVISLIETDVTEEIVVEFVNKYKSLPFYGIASDLNYLSTVKELLKGTGIRLSGIASYPLGGQTNATKIKQVEYAIAAGADEMDISMNYSAIKSGDFARVEAETKEMMDAVVGDNIEIIAIPQTSILTWEETIEGYRILSKYGVKGLKLNSGFGWNTHPEDVILVKRNFCDQFERIDVAGGVRTLAQVEEYLDLGANFIHSSTPEKIFAEIREAVAID